MAFKPPASSRKTTPKAPPKKMGGLSKPPAQRIKPVAGAPSPGTTIKRPKPGGGMKPPTRPRY